MKSIILYVNSKCNHSHVCIRYLLGKGIKFEVKDIFLNNETVNELREKNILSVPALFVDDKYTIGFNKESFDCLLKDI
ncbi:MAG: glutaredoxin domain-containing protein [Solirubrobacterales bacterium]